MKVGVCVGKRGLNGYNLAKQYGYDHVEDTFYILNEMNDTDFEDYKKGVVLSGIKCYSCNGFFSAKDFNLVTDKLEASRLDAMFIKGLDRAKALGAELIVVGSGKTRYLPDNMTRDQGMANYAEFLYYVGKEAEKRGLRIAVEPLNYKETNFINTVADGIEVSKLTGLESAGTIADFFHVFLSGETLEAIENNEGRLFHVHLARANEDRYVPTTDEDLECCRKWADALVKGNFKGRMSIEASFHGEFEKGINDVLKAVELFRKTVK